MRKHSFSPFIILALIILQTTPFARAQSGSASQWRSAIVRAAPLLQSREFKKTVEFEPGGNLTLKTDKGSARLTAWDRNQVEVLARIEAPENVSADYAQRAVEAAQIEVYGDARSLTVRSDFKDVPYKDGLLNRSKSLPDIHYEIRAPRNLNLSINIDRSKVEISGFEGIAKLNTDRTPVKASNLAGEFRLQIDRGKVTLNGFRGALDVESDRTDVELRAIEIEGDSRFDIDRGEIELRLPETQGLNIYASISRRGNFHSDFGLTMQSIRGKNFEGTINGGGSKLSIQADRARVRLKQQ